MAARDDFNSSMNSPGGWGGTGGSSMGGMGGQKASTYNYYGMPGSNAQANYNTGGGLLGTGNQFGVNRDTGMNMGGYPVSPVRMQPIPPIPLPVTYPPVTQEEIPGAPVMSRYGPRVGPNPNLMSSNPAFGFSLANMMNGQWGNGSLTGPAYSNPATYTPGVPKGSTMPGHNYNLGDGGFAGR